MLVVRREGRGELIDRFRLDRDATAKCLLSIDVPVHRARKNGEIVVRIRRIPIDIAAIVTVKHDGANGQISRNDWLVDEAIDLLVKATTVRTRSRDLGRHVLYAKIGLVGDISDRSSKGACAIQGALWPPQYFNSIQVKKGRIHVKVGRLYGIPNTDRERRVIKIKADCVVARQATQDDLVLAGRGGNNGEARCFSSKVHQCRRAGFLNRIRGNYRDAHRRVL